MTSVSRYLGVFSALLFITSGLSAAGDAVAKVDVDRLPSEVITTIAGVALDESGEGASVYADNDVRVLRVHGSLIGRIGELMDARKNGWEVRLSLVRDDENTFMIVDFEIKSRENKLSTGFTADRSFAPMVARSGSYVNELFYALYPYDSNKYDVSDNCFNRAHYWSRATQVRHQSQSGAASGTGMDKAFIFFSEAYTKKFKHKWWYHVAPMLYLQNHSRPFVFDPTFIGGPVTLNQWLSAFDENTGGRCQQISSIEEYYANNHRPICMYIVASMFNYTPSDLGRRRLTNWRCYDFDRMMAQIPAPYSRTGRSNVSWKDPEHAIIRPEICR